MLACKKTRQVSPLVHADAVCRETGRGLEGGTRPSGALAERPHGRSQEETSSDCLRKVWCKQEVRAVLVARHSHAISWILRLNLKPYSCDGFG